MRAIKLLREANIGLQTLQVILNALDLNDSEINPITLIPDDIANFVISLCYKDVDLFKLIEGLFAATSIAIIPVVIFYIIFQKKFIAGISSSAIKG